MPGVRARVYSTNDQFLWHGFFGAVTAPAHKTDKLRQFGEI